MSRSLLALALALLAAGCGTSEYHAAYARGHAANPTGGDVAALAADVACGALQKRPTVAPEPAKRPSLAERRPWRRIFGTVRWGAGARVAGIPVTLRSRSGEEVRSTTSDPAGRFWFPLPLPAGWYVVAAEDERGAGETRLWLHDEPPDFLEVVVE